MRFLKDVKADQVSFGSDREQWRLEVSDDGIGLPADFEPENANSMGLQSIQHLVQQLAGSMQVVREAGAKFAISFPQNTAPA